MSIRVLDRHERTLGSLPPELPDPIPYIPIYQVAA
jgi:hypothetical protein